MKRLMAASASGRRARPLSAFEALALGMAGVGLALFAPHAIASTVAPITLNVPQAPAIGSTNIAMADLLVPQGSTTPCAVPLFDTTAFASGPRSALAYSAEVCPGPWSKIVFVGDFTGTPPLASTGILDVTLAGVNLYYASTPEFDASITPTWHVERDVSDYAALFSTDQSGGLLLEAGQTNAPLPAVSGVGQLVFYPASQSNAGAPDQVIGLSAATSTTILTANNNLLATTVTLPTNVTGLQLDIIAYPVGGDESWFACTPASEAPRVGTCSGTPYRAVDVSIDGTLAGIAPIFPMLSGDMFMPSLWQPIPAAGALNMQPYRMNLTPFAGTLEDGAPHTVSFTVENLVDSCELAATLLIDQDPVLSQVTGSLTSNTLTGTGESNPVIHPKSTSSGGIKDKVSMSVSLNYTQSGSLVTSAGPVTNSVTSGITFSNAQTFNITSSKWSQEVQQTELASTSVTTTSGIGGHTATLTTATSYAVPLSFSVGSTNKDTIQDSWSQSVVDSLNGTPYFATATANAVTQASGGKHGVSGNQTYVYADTFGNCYQRLISAVGGSVSGVTTSETGCTTP